MQRDIAIIKHFKIPTAQTIAAVVSVLSQEVFYGYSSFPIPLEQAETEKGGWEGDVHQTWKSWLLEKPLWKFGKGSQPFI